MVGIGLMGCGGNRYENAIIGTWCAMDNGRFTFEENGNFTFRDRESLSQGSWNFTNGRLYLQGCEVVSSFFSSYWYLDFPSYGRGIYVNFDNNRFTIHRYDRQSRNTGSVTFIRQQ